MEFYPVEQTQYHEHFAGDFADHFAGQQQQQEPSPRAPTALPTGAVLVDAMGKVAAIEHTGESHAAVRCLLSAATDVKGCDLYLSRFPCSLCTKLAVQAGVIAAHQRKIYYFPAERWELAQVENDSSESDEAFRMREVERAEKNRKTVMRLVSNNPIAFTLFIPQWDHGDIDDEFIPPSPSKPSKKKQTTQVTPAAPKLSWPIDKKLEQSPGISRRWPIIELKFARTVAALNLLAARYHVQARPLGEWTRRYREGAGSGDAFSSVEEIDLSKTDEQVGLPLWARHAMVLAHIAAKRTDDPKLGVGSVFVDEEGRYFSVGWNGYPKKSQHLDYPQAGADDSVEYEELKYDYILHSEQNALLWRNPPGIRAKEAWVVVTKLPCDECSPILYDCGIRKCITIPQLPKGLDDPARLRGLTYNRVAGLMKEILLFEV
ncbi:Cytidine and dCMP deaminase domain-containing protein 1 [Chytriomyces hyalinus]|nr:Cytidine and dCMP deaminase domain-containing protein 1 [Chytriomyces hyalinus]